ncbi:la-related protein 6-like [Planococcus citri]|uniref:la-related protein 6-like n=1 Tax=Planococcus citri TaxID=170843 RepID=UPI0031F8C5A0
MSDVTSSNEETAVAIVPVPVALDPAVKKTESGDLIITKSAKLLENRCSISSVDSSISLSYDAVPFTPRSSLTISTDDESKIVNHFGINSSSSHTDSSSDAAVSGNESKKIKTNSGGDSSNDEEPFEAPDEELTKRIVDQVEYYFSDENIVKDAFLLKHVRRNKEGYVSLKLIASFKRVKHIARDWRVVRVALEKSTKLEINEAGTKLRRKDPLPLYDQTTPSRTVVAVDIPPEKATIECIAELFRTCGEIALVRILRPGNPIPADVRPFYNKHPEMHNTVSALVEFVRTESAHNALNRDAENDPNHIQVLELNAPPSKKKVAVKTKFPNRIYDQDYGTSSCASGSETDERYKLHMQRRCSSPHLTNKPIGSNNSGDQHWGQRRWSRDSGTDSSSSSFSRSRSNSGVYYIPEQRRLSAGWESSSDSYSSCRSRSNSGVSIPEVFHMRRYSLPRKEPDCCCCSFPKCESSGGAGRRYSVGRGSDDGYHAAPLSRCNSGESCDGPYRKESIPEYYPLHRSNGSFERRSSITKTNNDGPWSRNSSVSSASESGRRLSDCEGRGMVRQRSFGNNIGNLANSDTIVRLPRGPDGGRGFQRELIEYALPE